MGFDPASSTRRIGTAVALAVVVAAVALAPVASAAGGLGGALAQQENGTQSGTASASSSASQGGGSYAVQQGGQCYSISALTGNESVKQLYDYRVPFENNPYRTQNGTQYSSVGTVNLQRVNTSIVFLYEGPQGNLSLVFVHGKFNGNADGGSASFDITGLSRQGQWTVKDDKYAGPNNYDNWSHTPTTAQIDWTWGANATDGGAYEGLGERFEVGVDPAFNDEAALSDEYYHGNVTRWQVLSGGQGPPQRRTLDMSQPLTITSGGCNGAGGTPGGSGDTGTEDGGIGVSVGGDDGASVDAGEDGVEVEVGGQQIVG